MQKSLWIIVGMLSVVLGVGAWAAFERTAPSDSYARAEVVLAACRETFPDRDCTGGELPNGQFAWIAAPSAARVGFKRAEPVAQPPVPPPAESPAPVTPAK